MEGESADESLIPQASEEPGKGTDAWSNDEQVDLGGSELDEQTSQKYYVSNQGEY